MKYFEHGYEIPSLLARRATQPVVKPPKAWNSFKRGGKSSLQLIDDLLPRQYHLCSYCENRLSDSPGSLGFHIEHILSKSLNPSLTFEYTNLMLSCFKDGSEASPSEEDPEPVSCGHARLKASNGFDETFFIKPTEADCERYFFYELEGEIVPHPDLNDQGIERAQHTIDVLNLNCLRLKRLRSDVIDRLSRSSAELVNHPLQLEFFIQQELSVREGELAQFWTTRKQLLSPG